MTLAHNAEAPLCPTACTLLAIQGPRYACCLCASLLSGPSSPSWLHLHWPGPHDTTLAWEQGPPNGSPCLGNLVPSHHPPPCDRNDLSATVSLLSPSEVVHGLQEMSWVGRVTPSLPPPLRTPHTCTSPSVAGSLMWLHMFLPLSGAGFSLVPYVVIPVYSSKLNIAVTSKESTLTSPSW